jgi:hypothetical protein
LFLSLPGRAHISATTSPSLLPLSPSLSPGGRSTEPHRAGGARWDGRASQAARTPRDRSVLTRESNPARTGKYPFYPAPHTPLHLSLCKGGSSAASAARAVQAGAAWGFRLAVAVPGFKSEGGGREPDVQATNPIGVFPFLFSWESAVRGRKKEAPPLCRAKEGRGHTGTPTTRQGRSAPPPRRAGRGRSRERGAGSEEPGARTGAAGDDRWREHLLHRERLHRPEHHRHASDDHKPATTTPPPHREHRPTNLFSTPPWSLSCDESATSRRVARLFMPGCWPSRRRTAVPRRRELLSRSCSWAPPSPCDENVWDRPSCQDFLCRYGCVRRRLASSRASGYQSAAPSGHGEAARAQAGLWPHTGMLWTRSRG